VNYKDRPLATIPRKLLARELAYVPQVHRDAFTYSVIDVVLMGRMPYHSFFSAYSDTDYQIAYDALVRLGIGSLRDRPYTEISGGERQLTLIARSVAQGARTFIMDEPVNGLDYGNQMRLLRSIRTLADEGYTFIITTHFPDHALMCADRVVLLKNGIVLADGLPNEIITRETIYSLYRVEVDVVPVNGSGSFCVPVWSN
jgi:iron complex transport system ATP-binding protein